MASGGERFVLELNNHLGPEPGMLGLADIVNHRVDLVQTILERFARIRAHLKPER